MFRKIIKGLKDVWCGTLEFDTEPKKGSFNPVTSDGVYEAINGAGGAKEIVYFEVDQSNPPSGIYDDIAEVLSNGKLPAIRSDGKLYQYTSTVTGLHTFVGVFSNSEVGYEDFEVYDNDTVKVGKLNASLGYATLPADGTEEHPAWAKVCELDLENFLGYTSYGLALLFTSDHINNTDGPSESGIFVFDVGSDQSRNSNSRNASWIAYTKGSPYEKILGVKIIAKYGVPSNPAYAPYPFYKAEVWVKYYGTSRNIIVKALQDSRYNSSYGMVQGLYKFPDNHIATPQSTEPSYDDTEEYKYKEFFYHAQAPTDGSCLITNTSDWQTLDGTNVTLRYVWPTDTPAAVTGDKIRLATTEGETKYHVEVAALGAYRIDVNLYVKWDGTPVNRTGKIFKVPLDFSRNFEALVGRMSNIIKIPYSAQEYYGFGFQVRANDIDAPNGVKLSIQVLVEYIGPVPQET